MANSRAILLLSGGLDSSSLLFWMKNNGYDPVPLFVDYGQPTAAAEWNAAVRIAHAAGMPPPLHLALPGFASWAQALDSTGPETQHSKEYFPSRNLLLITLASICAYHLGISAIMIGIISGTSGLFPDTSPNFLKASNRVLLLEHSRLSVEAPFADREKLDVVSEAMRFGLPLQLTFSCNKSSPYHCWGCSSCMDRYTILSRLGLIG